MMTWTRPERDEELEKLLAEVMVPLYSTGYYSLNARKRQVDRWGHLLDYIFRRDIPRNSPCACNSGRKFKVCCKRRREVLIKEINTW